MGGSSGQKESTFDKYGRLAEDTHLHCVVERGGLMQPPISLCLAVGLSRAGSRQSSEAVTSGTKGVLKYMNIAPQRTCR